VGSFYARFGGKEDLIRYLQDRVWSEARERWDEALAREDWAELPMARVVEGVVGLLFRSLRADFQRRRVLGRNRLQDPEGAGKAMEFHEHVLATVTPILLARREEVTHPRPEEAVRLGFRFASGAIREMLEMEGATDALVEELARAWTAYLCFGAEGPEASPEGEVDFFDPWG
jgi:AcrR family transcriptional regulator